VELKKVECLEVEERMGHEEKGSKWSKGTKGTKFWLDMESKF
jgi:hypothetical protein